MKKQWIRRLGLLMLLLAAIAAAGCGQGAQNSQPLQGGRTVTDSKGTVMTLPLKPQRIVSLSIAADEMLIALVPLERIAALTYLADDLNISNITAEAKAVRHKVRANAEAVIALQPDLVLLADWHPPELAQSMRDMGIPVFVYKSARSMEEIKANLQTVAELTGEQERGQKVIADMELQLREIAAKVAVIPEGEQQVAARFSNMGGSGGIGSTFNEICRYAGVKNTAALVGLDMSGVLTKEQIVRINPDFMLLPAWDFSGKQDLARYQAEVQNDPALQTVTAIRDKRLYQLPDRYLFCTSQHIVQGVRSVAQTAYPQLFVQ